MVTGKTQCVLMKGTLERDAVIRLNGEKIRKKTVSKYPGVKTDEMMNFVEYVEMVCGRAAALMQNIIMSIARRQYHIRLPALKVYMNAVMAAILGYRAHRLILVKPRAAVRRT